MYLFIYVVLAVGGEKYKVSIYLLNVFVGFERMFFPVRKQKKKSQSISAKYSSESTSVLPEVLKSIYLLKHAKCKILKSIYLLKHAKCKILKSIYLLKLRIIRILTSIYYSKILVTKYSITYSLGIFL